MTRWRWPVVQLLVVAALAVAATFTGPTLQLEVPTWRQVFVFDITDSMNAEDVELGGEAVTRLAYAKRNTLDAMTRMPCGTEAGLALFAGHRAFLLSTPIEVCANYRELSAMLSNISGRMIWEPRSEVAKGLYKSLALMTQLPAETRLVFLSDGDEAPPIDPRVTPRFGGEIGAVRGLIVGVGGHTPAPIPKFDDTGKRIGEWTPQDFANRGSDLPPHMAPVGFASAHLSALREDYLQSLATQTGLGYVRLTAADALARAIADDSLALPRTQAVDVRAWLGGAAFVFLLLSLMWRERRLDA